MTISRKQLEETLARMERFFSPEAHAEREQRHWERQNPQPLEDLLLDEDEHWARDLL